MKGNRGVISAFFAYIIVIIIGVFLIIIFLEFFTPYRISSLFQGFISSLIGSNPGSYA